MAFATPLATAATTVLKRHPSGADLGILEGVSIGFDSSEYSPQQCLQTI